MRCLSTFKWENDYVILGFGLNFSNEHCECWFWVLKIGVKMANELQSSKQFFFIFLFFAKKWMFCDIFYCGNVNFTHFMWSWRKWKQSDALISRGKIWILKWWQKKIENLPICRPVVQLCTVEMLFVLPSLWHFVVHQS